MSHATVPFLLHTVLRNEPAKHICRIHSAVSSSLMTCLKSLNQSIECNHVSNMKPATEESTGPSSRTCHEKLICINLHMFTFACMCFPLCTPFDSKTLEISCLVAKVTSVAVLQCQIDAGLVLHRQSPAMSKHLRSDQNSHQCASRQRPRRCFMHSGLYNLGQRVTRLACGLLLSFLQLLVRGSQLITG